MTNTETVPPEAHGATEAAVDTATPPKAGDFGAQLAGAAAYVAELPRRDRAVLRRMEKDPDGVPPEVFWRMVERYRIPPAHEPFWVAVLPLMVKHPHRRGARPGAVLRRAGVKPPRLERWLRLDAEGARREANRLLSRVDGPVDWVRLGRLLRYWGEDDRRAMARDYYLTSDADDHTEPTEGD